MTGRWFSFSLRHGAVATNRITLTQVIGDLGETALVWLAFTSQSTALVEDQPKTWYTKIITLNICIYVFIYLFGCIRLAHIVAAYRLSCFIAGRISAPQAGIKLPSPILQGRPPTTAHQGSPENHPLLTSPELHFWQIQDSMFCSSSCQKWSSTSQSSLLNLKIPPRGE